MPLPARVGIIGLLGGAVSVPRWSLFGVILSQRPTKEDNMRPNFGKAILGGLVGTILLTLVQYFVAPLVTGQRMDVAAMLG